jgi:hypothetical protein
MTTSFIPVPLLECQWGSRCPELLPLVSRSTPFPSFRSILPKSLQIPQVAQGRIFPGSTSNDGPFFLTSAHQIRVKHHGPLLASSPLPYSILFTDFLYWKYYILTVWIKIKLKIYPRNIPQRSVISIFKGCTCDL